MAAQIDTISPGRGRVADSISLLGSGFSPTPAQNAVTVDGIAATVTFDSATQVDVTVPGGIGVGEHVPVVITNLDDATSFTSHWWSKELVANLGTEILPTKIPFKDEIDKGLSNQDLKTAEAKYFERIVAVLELLGFDLVSAKGKLATMGGTGLGLREVVAGALGEFLHREPAGAIFRANREVFSLHWGRRISLAETTPQLMFPGAIDFIALPVFPFGMGTEEVVPRGGRINVVSVFCRRANPVGSRVVTVEVLVNGIVVHTENLLPGIQTGQSVTFFPWLAVVQGDRVEIQLTKNNATSTMEMRALVQTL